MTAFKWTNWVRPNILAMDPYRSARDEFSGQGMIFLDANENPFDSGLNRYPDPFQTKLKTRLADFYDLERDQLFLGNGSDEAIDLLIRVSCEPQQDRILCIAPSYGMYKVSAAIQNVEVDEVVLNDDFSLPVQRLLAAYTDSHKLLFLCSPNNPTGNSFDLTKIESIIAPFKGVVVVDQAYADFAGSQGGVDWLQKYPNVVLLRTFSKAWGLAGVRFGFAMGHPDLIALINKVKYPYNLNLLTQKTVQEALESKEEVFEKIRIIQSERERLSSALKKMSGVLQVFPSDANFVLIKVKHPHELYQQLLGAGIVVRNRSSQVLCAGCLRISVGTPDENLKFLQVFEALMT